MSAEGINNQVASPINMFHYIWVDIWREIGDPVSEDYFWTQRGPWLTWLVSLAYLYIVLKAGPDFMKNRKPYHLPWSIRLYNFILVLANGYLFVRSMSLFRNGRDFWGCGKALRRGTEDQVGVVHLFFHLRYLEFFDTFFFVLRKKNSQISFLHVFHHGIVPSLMYVGLKFYPVPFNALLPTTNMFVHIIMYGYYGLATFGPGIQKYLWWKKYLTTMQISQFALLIVHCSQPIIFQVMQIPGCNFPTGLLIINYSIGLTFLLLFIGFYRQTYLKAANNKKDVQHLVRNFSKVDSKLMNGVGNNHDSVDKSSVKPCSSNDLFKIKES